MRQPADSRGGHTVANLGGPKFPVVVYSKTRFSKIGYKDDSENGHDLVLFTACPSLASGTYRVYYTHYRFSNT